MLKNLQILFSVLLLTVGVPAQAAWVTRTYDFTATDWFNTPPSPPVGTLVGSVTVTFDTTDGSHVERTTGITLNSLNVTLGSTIGFIYDPTGFLPGTGIETLFIGGVANGVGTVFDTDDFGVSIENPTSSAPSLSVALLSTADPQAYWRSETGTVTATTVPAPATLALLGAGIAGLGLVRRRKAQ